MNKQSNKLLDDIVNLCADTAKTVQAAGTEVGNILQTQVQQLTNTLDLVSREQFEIVKQMAEKAREENDKLSLRIDELENQINQLLNNTK